MDRNIDHYDIKHPEPIRSCVIALGRIILASDKLITAGVKWGMPFFSYKEKMLCYIWVDKKRNQPYIGFMDGNKMEHHALEKGDRKRVKIYTVDPEKDIDLESIQMLVGLAINVISNK